MASQNTKTNKGRIISAPSIIITLSIILISMGQGLDAPYTYSYVGFGILYLLPLLSHTSFISQNSHSPYYLFTIFCFIITIVFGILTYLSTGEFSFIVSSFVYSTIFLSVVIFSTKIKDSDLLPPIKISLIISFIFIFLISIYSSQFNFYRYQGMFSNPNQMGRACVSVLSVLIPIILIHRTNNSKQKMDYAVVLLATLLVVSSNSRLSLIATLFTAIITIFVYCVFNNVKRKIIIYLSLLISALLLIYSFGIFDEVLNKFIIVQERGDISQGRVDNWSYIIDKWTWFGHGEDPYSIFDYGAHNLFLSYLDRQGLLMAIAIYTPFVICFLRSAYICFFKHNKLNNYEYTLSALALNTSFCFIAVGMAEATTISALTVAAMLGVACWLNVENRILKFRNHHRV
jgi:hypothetical protein